MGIPKNKVKLSPRLQLGVGRQSKTGNFLKYLSFVFLVLSSVLAIRAGYMVFHHSSDVNSQKGQVLGATDTPTTSGGFMDYKVQKGQTLFTISQEFNIDWTTLATINNLKPPFPLKPGDILKVPKQ